uniref:Uncharacterized protein n=1 Tax=Fagus sylvatica TaxID=28930 RepID=A0A2N9HLB9_FAGSY
MEKRDVAVTTWESVPARSISCYVVRMFVKQMGFFGLCESWAGYGINPIFQVHSLLFLIFCFFAF